MKLLKNLKNLRMRLLKNLRGLRRLKNLKTLYHRRTALLLTGIFVMLIGFQNCMDSDFSGKNRRPGSVNSLESAENLQNVVFELADFNIVQSITAGSDHACVILSSEDESVEGGLVKCWGRNDSGQLGSDQVQSSQDEGIFVDLGTEHTAKAITAGDKHTCVILNNDRVKCWGANDDGQLGLGDTNHRGGDIESEMGDNLPYVDLGEDRTAKALFARYNYTCATLDNDQLKCWGDNYFGQLGLGDTNNRGDEPYEMSDDLPYVDLGEDHTVKAVTAGKNHTCAILDNDRLKCWGINNFGQLGLEDTISRGDSLDEMGENLTFVNLGSGRTVKTITAGDSYTCAILDNDQLSCWGLNLLFGQTSAIDYLGDEADEMGDNLGYVQLGTTDRVAHFVTGGPYHICVGLDDDQLKCWGRNDRGQLGLGDVEYRGDTIDESVTQLPLVDLGTDRSVQVLVAGDRHTCGLLDDNKVKCWGSNEYHQLWLSDTADHRGDALNEMGNNLPYIEL